MQNRTLHSMQLNNFNLELKTFAYINSVPENLIDWKEEGEKFQNHTNSVKEIEDTNVHSLNMC